MNDEELEKLKEALLAIVEGLNNSTAATEDFVDGLIDSADSFGSLDESTDSVKESQEAYLKVAKDVNKIVKGYSEGLKGLASATLNMAKSFTQAGESLDSLRAFIEPVESIIESTFGLLGTVADGLLTGLGNIAGILPGIGEALSGFMDGLGNMTKGLFDKFGKALAGAAGMLANAMITALEDAISMFKGTTSAGLLFTTGIKGMVGQMNDLMLFQEEYVQVVQNNANALTRIGGTVADGMNKVTKTVKLFDSTFLSSGVSMRNELYNMGIGYQESTEGLIDYMDQLAITGNLQQLTASELAFQSGLYMKNLKVISALTGKTADEMLKERDEALSNLAFRNKLSKMTAEQQEEIMAAMGRVPKEGQKAFKEAIVFGKVMTDVGAITTGMAGHYESLAQDLLSGTTNAKDAISGFMQGIKDDLPRLEQAFQSLDAVGMAALVGAGNAVSDAIAESVNGQITLAMQAGKFTQAKFDAAWESGAKEGALGLEDFFNNLRDTYGTVAQALVTHSKTLISLAKTLSGFVADIVNDIAAEAADGNFNFIDFISKQMRKLFNVGEGEGIVSGLASDAMQALGIAEMWESLLKKFEAIKIYVRDAMDSVTSAMNALEAKINGFTVRGMVTEALTGENIAEIENAKVVKNETISKFDAETQAMRDRGEITGSSPHPTELVAAIREGMAKGPTAEEDVMEGDIFAKSWAKQQKEDAEKQLKAITKLEAAVEKNTLALGD